MQLIVERNINGYFREEKLTNCEKIEFMPLSRGLKVIHNNIVSIVYIDVEEGDTWEVTDD